MTFEHFHNALRILLNRRSDTYFVAWHRRNAMTLAKFHNALRILLSTDRDEFYEAIGRKDAIAWRSFIDNPFRWFIMASDADAAAVWEIICKRNECND
jgi:hypothetical protein